MTIISKAKRRKIAIWFGRVPSSIRTLVNRILPTTTRLIAILEHPYTDVVVKITPFVEDDMIRMALLKALKAFEAEVEAVKDLKERKRLAGKVGKFIVAYLDNHNLTAEQYDALFETVFEETKGVIV